MAGRRNDFGDQYPSDINDGVPSNPTAGFQEIDYDPSSFQGNTVPKAVKRAFQPDAKVENVPTPKRETLYGILLSKLPEPSYPITWNILTQEGKIVQAYTTNSFKYEKRRPGDEVVLIRGNNENDWTFINRAPTKEMQSIDVYNGSSSSSSKTFTVTFDTVRDQVPISDIYSDDEPNHKKLKISGGGVKVLEEDEAWYEINFNLTVTHSASSGSVPPQSKHTYATACWSPDSLTDMTDSSEPFSVKRLFLNPSSGMRLYYDPSDCSANIGVYSTLEDSVLNQQFIDPLTGLRQTNQFAEWTDAPRFGGNVHVATQTSTGWLKIGRTGRGASSTNTTGGLSATGPYVWHTHDEYGLLRVKWPGKGPRKANVETETLGIGQVLTVVGGEIDPKKGDGIQLGFGALRANVTYYYEEVLTPEIDHIETCVIHSYCWERVTNTPPDFRCFTQDQNGQFTIPYNDEDGQHCYSKDGNGDYIKPAGVQCFTKDGNGNYTVIMTKEEYNTFCEPTSYCTNPVVMQGYEQYCYYPVYERQTLRLVDSVTIENIFTQRTVSFGDTLERFFDPCFNRPITPSPSSNP